METYPVPIVSIKLPNRIIGLKTALCSFLLIVACQPAELPPEEYMNWVQDEANGLTVQYQTEHLSYLLQYKPKEAMLLQQRPQQLQDAEIKRYWDELGQTEYFTLKIKSNHPGTDLLNWNLEEGVATSGSRIQYFSFAFQEDLTLTLGSDSLKCELFHFEQPFGLSPYLTFSLGFPMPENRPDDRVLHLVNRAFGSEEARITIPQQAIAKIPKLKL